MDRILVTISIAILVAVNINAQKGFEVGGWLGTSHYYGDLNTTLRIQKPGIAAGIIGKYNLNTRISFRSSLNYGKVAADDASSTNNYERSRNLQFSSIIFDMSNAIEFNFFDFVHGSKDRVFTPFIYGGFNVFYYNPKADLNGVSYNLRKMGTEGQYLGQEYNTFGSGWLLGGGIKYALNKNANIAIEISTRFLSTDYLDDVSTTFPDKSELISTRGPIAVSLSDRSLNEGFGQVGRQRGDSKDNDRYVFFGISYLRYFGGISCPNISKI